jgi:hypothetical protein
VFEIRVSHTCLRKDIVWSNIGLYSFLYGTAIAQWLSCCTTSRKVAGSIPDGVSGIFH